MTKLSEFKRKGPPKVVTIQCQNCGMDKSVPAYATYRRYCDLACLKMAREKKKRVDMYYKKSQTNNFKYVKELKEKPTKAELVVKSWLEQQNIRFLFQKGFLVPFHRIADFYIPKKKIIIEIDGGYHDNSEQYVKDTKKDEAFLVERGMKTMRITNEQVYSSQFKSILAFLGN